MPLLPEIEIRVPQWNRLKEVLEGETIEEKTETYERIVLNALEDYARSRRRQLIYEKHQKDLEIAIEEDDKNPDNLIPSIPNP